MLKLGFTPRAYSRGYGLPDARLVNMFSEATPGGPNVDARFPRPGLLASSTLGSGPIRGIFRKQGVYGGGTFVASANTLYFNGASVGTITGTDLVRFDASTSQVVAVADGKAYLYGGSTFAQITDTDLPTVSDVAVFAGRFIYPQAGSGRFYWSEVNDAANIDGLSFATAEGSPDATIGVRVYSDVMQFFGGETVETWYASGDPDTPFQKSTGRTYARGCASRDAIALLDNTAFWVGEDRNVYRGGDVPQRVSTHGIEDALRRCTTISATTAIAFTFEGHPFYVLNIPGQGSFAYDVAGGPNGEWAEWESYGRTVFRGRVAAQIDGAVYIGDDTTNAIYTLAKGTHQDVGGQLRRIASAFAEVDTGRPRCNVIALTCAKGVGNTIDPGLNPLVEMKFSDDMGKTWSPWRSGALGKIGEYDTKVWWRRLGLMRSPGRVFEFRCADPVLATFSHLTINETRP